jgi:hypothetical protein
LSFQSVVSQLELGSDAHWAALLAQNGQRAGLKAPAVLREFAEELDISAVEAGLRAEFTEDGGAALWWGLNFTLNSERDKALERFANRFLGIGFSKASPEFFRAELPDGAIVLGREGGQYSERVVIMLLDASVARYQVGFQMGTRQRFRRPTVLEVLTALPFLDAALVDERIRSSLGTQLALKIGASGGESGHALITVESSEPTQLLRDVAGSLLRRGMSVEPRIPSLSDAEVSLPAWFRFTAYRTSEGIPGATIQMTGDSFTLSWAFVLPKLASEFLGLGWSVRNNG